MANKILAFGTRIEYFESGLCGTIIELSNVCGKKHHDNNNYLIEWDNGSLGIVADKEFKIIDSSIPQTTK